MRNQLHTFRGLRVAFLHDWLFHMRGGENCLNDLCELLPDSEIFTLFTDDEAELSQEISSHPIFRGRYSKLRNIRKIYRKLLPFYPRAVGDLEARLAERHRVKPFDIVISVSHCAVKNVRVPDGVVHVCYCLTPARYLWDQYRRYLRNPVTRILAQPLRMLLRRWDVAGSEGVTHFIAISEFVALRIAAVYGRDSLVVYPGVARPEGDRKAAANSDLSESSGFLCVNALVPYKNTHLIVEAFRRLDLPLTIVGSGPEEEKLRSMAGPKTKFLSGLSTAELWEQYRNAKALVFAAEEDFGMTPVECQFAGRPVICFGRGGACETVKDGETGIYFNDLSAEAICSAVRGFLDRENGFSLESCRLNAERFSRERFAESFLDALSSIEAVQLEELSRQHAAAR